MISPFEHPVLNGLINAPKVAALWSADAQIAHYKSFEAAFSKALGLVGKVEGSIAEQAVDHIVAVEIAAGDLHIGMERDGVPIPALVRLLRAGAGGCESAIHTGATSQDVIDTALALTLRSFSDLLENKLCDLLDAFEILEARFGTRTMMGRTRMQAAVPICVTHRISQWQEPLRTHFERLKHKRANVELVQLAGPVGDDQVLADVADAVRYHLAQDLGLSVPKAAWHTDRSALAEYAGLLSLITGSLGKLGRDICLMAQQGIDEVTIKTGGMSSAMPHKSNPIAAELLVTLAAFNATQLSAMHHALVHEQERSGSAWMLEWMILPQMAAATDCALRRAQSLVEGITTMGTETP